MVPDNGVMKGNPHMTLLHTLMITVSAAALLLATGVVQAQDIDRSSLPIPLSKLEGKSGKTYKESEAAWQHPPAAPQGAPNIIVILLDDVGFGQPSTFGGLIPTPNLDKLAS
jgi:hypothetical protein